MCKEVVHSADIAGGRVKPIEVSIRILGFLIGVTAYVGVWIAALLVPCFCRGAG
jgi:hypothetical protein